MIDPDHFLAIKAERDRLLAEVAWLRALVDRLTARGPDTGPGTAGVGAKVPPMPPSPYTGATITYGPPFTWTINSASDVSR